MTTLALRSLEKDLLLFDAVPLFGGLPALDLTLLAKHIGKALDLSNPQLRLSPQEWAEHNETHAGLISVQLALSGLEGFAFIEMSRVDLQALLMHCLLEKAQHSDLVPSDEFFLGFATFVFASVCMGVHSALSELTPTVLGFCQRPAGAYFCSGFRFQSDGGVYSGTVFISGDLTKSVQKAFAPKKPKKLSQELAQSIEVTLILEGGQAALTLEQWYSVKVGDCIILDSCSLRPDSHKSRCVASLNGKPIFRAKIDDGRLELVDYNVVHDTRRDSDELASTAAPLPKRPQPVKAPVVAPLPSQDSVEKKEVSGAMPKNNAEDDPEDEFDDEDFDDFDDEDFDDEDDDDFDDDFDDEEEDEEEE